MKRCEWVPLNNELYVRYHDEDWGVPVHSDRKLFEMLILEGAQAGLSWLTILKKRENYRKAFDGWDFEKIALYNEGKVEELMGTPLDISLDRTGQGAIVRNRLKINSAIRNVKVFIDIRKEFGSFDKYIWGFVDGKPIKNGFKSMSEMPANTPLSDTISKDLKKRGFKFDGSTVVYAHMQATGMVNDHLETCFRYNEVS